MAPKNQREQPDDAQVPLIWHDSILRNAYYSALLLGVVLGGLSVFGVIRYPHWIWAAPIAAAVIAITANQRIRHTSSRVESILLGTATLVCLVAAALLAGLAIRIAR